MKNRFGKGTRALATLLSISVAVMSLPTTVFGMEENEVLLSETAQHETTLTVDVESKNSDLPEGAGLEVNVLAEGNEEAYVAAIENEMDETVLENPVVVEVNILDEEGETAEIEGSVEMSFTDEAFEERTEELEVFFFEEGSDEHEVLEATVTRTEDGVTVETDRNGVYVISATKEAGEPVVFEATAENGVSVIVTDENRAFPEGTRMEVTAVEDEHVAEAVNEALGTESGNIKAVDITFLNEEDEEIEPAAGVNVRISLPEKETFSEELQVVHISENGAEEMAIDEIADGAVTFTTDAFSVYVVVDPEVGTIVTPRVEFHFIDADAHQQADENIAYYEGTAYTFLNKGGKQQTTQILKNGETLEMITDPTSETENDFYGWYEVESYTAEGAEENALNFTWPENPRRIEFETAITIDETNIAAGETVHWHMGTASGSGKVDQNGNVHVYLAPVFENYNFVSFMLYARNTELSGASNVMTRKLVARGSANNLEVKISDISSNSTDSTHLIFTGWEYNAGTEEEENWITIPTIDYFGEEICQEGKDGTYLNVDLSGYDLPDGESIDLYPIFVEARWIDFNSGLTGSGASFIGSRYLESWGRATTADTPEEEGKNISTSLDIPTRTGYAFDGWYAFAIRDSKTGDITNLNEEKPVTVNYIDSNYKTHSVTIDTKAVKIADANGEIVFDGEYTLTDGEDTVKLFSAENGELKLYDALDRLNLFAGWTSDKSNITIVYWTENAEDDEYTASTVRTLSTAQINAQRGTNFDSGKTITVNDLKAYKDADFGVGILDTAVLSKVGAVPAGEEIFYDFNEKASDESVKIAGDGSTVFNVYYSRKVFTLVFHIGHDGYISTSGDQKSSNGGNWAQGFYNDAKATPYDNAKYTGSRGASVKTTAVMTYTDPVSGEKTSYDATYELNRENVLNDYVPAADENVYTIRAKFGSYIGDRWPTPSNTNFEFTDNNNNKEMYTWSAYYESLYTANANARGNSNSQGDHPDINGVYNYMSAELCADRTGKAIINENQAHHFVAYFGDQNKSGVHKTYHLFFEAIDGTYDAETAQLIQGSDYEGFPRTTWTTTIAGQTNASAIRGHVFYQKKGQAEYDVISNLVPEHQLGWDLDGYELVYSCYNTPEVNDHHIYFFYTPKQYTITFYYEDEKDRKVDSYYYTQSLKDAKKYDDPAREGYRFLGWYTNEAGSGKPFNFAKESMPAGNIVLYPVFEKLNYVIKIDPNGGEIDRWRENSSSAGASTGFRADFKETISAYNFLERNYIETNDEEIALQGLNKDTDVYYYMNAQYISEEHDGEFIPARLRSALYLTESEIDTYWEYYSSISKKEFTERRATKITDKNEWMDYYFGGHDVNELTKYRKTRGAEHYSFMGWFQVHEDGSVASAPFNFNTLVTENIEIRAMWRLDGGFYIRYNPCSLLEENGVMTLIEGELQQWTDPKDPVSQLYADKTPTHILRAPKNVTEGYIFRGWRVVRATEEKTYTRTVNGEEKTFTYTNWEPIEFDAKGEVVYYQPGDEFMVSAELATENPEKGAGAIIHMQAVYEKQEDSYRLPGVTNLVLDANTAQGGSLNTQDSSKLPALAGPGSSFIEGSKILFGDIQSNLAVDLAGYAAEGKFFSHEQNYRLLGFDEESAPESLSTGKPYIPAFGANAVIAVTRDDDRTLYAVWEPMIYITFVNTTEEDITADLTGTGEKTVSVINRITGTFDREQATTSIVVPAKGSVKIVLPAAAAEESFTATAENKNHSYKLNVSGEFDGNAYGTGSEGALYGEKAIFTAPLRSDAKGITVTYSKEDLSQVVFDVNGGQWQETSAAYVNTAEDLYTIDEAEINDNEYQPADPAAAAGQMFLGWTTNADIAAHTDFSSAEEVTWGETTITPEMNGNVLEEVKASYLWDFSQNPPYGQTLYAVYSETVTVTFDITRTGANLHTWTGEVTTEAKPYAFYRANGTAKAVTYTLMRGDKIPQPEAPEFGNPRMGYSFLRWVTNNSFVNKATYPMNINDKIFDFEKAVTESQTVFTSWMEDRYQRKYTFTVKNNVEAAKAGEEFEYTISAVSNMNFSGTYYDSTPSILPVKTLLKNGEAYTIEVTAARYRASNWDHNSLYVEVIDRNGLTLCSGHMLEYVGNYESSDYQCTVTVTQTAKEGYITSFDTQNGSVLQTGEQTYTFGTGRNSVTNKTVTTEAQSFTFRSAHGNKGFVGAAENDEIGANKNDVTEEVVFTNISQEAPLAAPTGFGMGTAPFALILLAGLALAALAVLRKRV